MTMGVSGPCSSPNKLCFFFGLEGFSNWCTLVGALEGAQVRNSSWLFSLLETSFSWYSAMSQRTICPFMQPADIISGFDGQNWNEYTSVGACSSRQGWIGSLKLQIKITDGERSSFGAKSIRSYKDTRWAQDTAMIPEIDKHIWVRSSKTRHFTFYFRMPVNAS